MQFDPLNDAFTRIFNAEAINLVVGMPKFCYF